MARGLKVAFLDGDMGQSTLGPPGTLAMRVYDSTIQDLEIPQFSDDVLLFFIGSFTPVGQLLQTIVGVQELVKKAEAQRVTFLFSNFGRKNSVWGKGRPNTVLDKKRFCIS